MHQKRFDGRVAVITGSGRGLGRAYALLLASRGAKIIVNDTGADLKGVAIESNPAEVVAQEIRSNGGEAAACVESVATRAGGNAIIQAALDHYGRLDILIHNAGNRRKGSLRELSYDDFDEVLDVHMRGAFHVVKPAFPRMCDAGYGRVVLTSSIVGLYGNHRTVNYAMGKSSMMGLSNVIALEGAAHGVKSNLILPGAITRMAGERDTSSYPPTMSPDVVAHAVGWLAHEACSITGEMLVAMGGRVARAYVAETRGAFSAGWSIEQIDEQMSTIRDMGEQAVFDPVPSGHDDHIHYSFEMGRKAKLESYDIKNDPYP